MREFLDLLHSQDFIRVSDNVDILKGKNELVTNWRDAFQKIKRQWQKKEL